MAKNNIRSFRYSDCVAEILEQQKGNSLNEKFENLVLYCHEQQPRIEITLKHYEKLVDEKRGELAALQGRLSSLHTLEGYIAEIERRVKQIKQFADSL